MCKAIEPDHEAAIGSRAQPAEPTQVLFVSPVLEDHAALAHIFAGSHWRPRSAFSEAEAITALTDGPIPVVICERDLLDGNWTTLLRELLNLPLPPRMIVCSRLADDKLWADVIAMGGEDVLPAPFERGETWRLVFLAWVAWRRSNGEG